MQNTILRVGILSSVCVIAWACSSQSGGCIKLTPTSRGCASPEWFAEPPPAPSLPSVSSSWTQTTAERAVSANPSIHETSWTVARPPYGQHDFVALRRLAAVSEGQSVSSRPVFLFLPEAHQHSEIIIPDDRYDLRLFLAKQGIDTWTLDYRTHFLPRDQIYDSTFMQEWTAEAFIDDVTAAAHFVREVSGGQKIFVGGFGRGAAFAALYAARSGREDLLGLVLLDGYVLDPPDVEPLSRGRTPAPNWFADDLEGQYMPYKRWMKILQEVIDDPAGPDFLSPPVFDNRAETVAHFLYMNANFGAQGGLSNAKEGYTDISVLARIFQNQDRYWPRVQNHGGFELKRHLANSRFDYEKGLTSMNVPILAFSCGNIEKGGIIWAGRIKYSAFATSTREVQFRLLENWGHLDMLFGTSAAQEVFLPLAEWLIQHNAGTSSWPELL